MKKFISITLAIALVITTVNFADSVRPAIADEVTTVEEETTTKAPETTTPYVPEVISDPNEWVQKAIIAPADGDLVGAGYITVLFNNTMEDYTYTVQLDGKPVYWIGDDIVRTDIGETVTSDAVTKTFTSEDSGYTEVYTTTVSKHKITVTASNGADTYTATRDFYVSKKGMALGGDMSDKVSLSKLNCSWYYNWATDPFNNSIDAGVEHTPMMWGGADDNKEAMQNLQTYSNYILGFNEPDIGSQANMMFFQGIDIWNEYISPLNLRKISPAPASPGGDSGWLKMFMTGGYKCINPWDGSWGLYSDYLDDATKTWVDGVADDVDAVCLHYYRSEMNLEGLKAAVQTLWNTYHKPIWITELSVFGMKNTTVDFSYEIPERRQEMAEYVQGIVDYLDDVPCVERYCWFSYNIVSANKIDAWNGSGATAMFKYSTGEYTELGKLYSDIGNPEGYNAEVISDDEMYVFDPNDFVDEDATTGEITTEQNTTVEIPTTTKVEETTTVKVEPSTTKATVTVAKPSKVKLKTAKNLKKKSVTLKWNKTKNSVKYQIQYSLNRKFNKAKKYKTKTKTTKKLTITIKKLAKKKTYYFRVRGVNGKLYGNWSNVKKVKIKK